MAIIVCVYLFISGTSSENQHSTEESFALTTCGIRICCI